MPRTAIPSTLWKQLCMEVEPGTVVERPYEVIHLAPHIEGGFGAFVETPFSPRGEEPSEEVDGEDLPASGPGFELPEVETNECVPVDSDIGKQLVEVFEKQVDQTVEHQEFGKRFSSALISDGAFAATFVYFTRLHDAPHLVTQFKELMVTLEHADTTDAVAFGTDVQPNVEPRSDHSYDIGMQATVYLHTTEPHKYWSDCDTLEDYIDMIVENGANRAEMESRESFYNHIHPQTSYQSLTAEQEQALEDWHTSLQSVVDEDLTFTQTPLRQRIGEVSVTEDGTVELECVVSVGDELPAHTDD